MTEFAFTEKAVTEAALAAAGGPSDFGEDGFRDGLRVLLETYEKAAGYNDKGRKRSWRRVVQLLTVRLKAQAAFAAHPQIREREIRSPVYLTGLPRTGTSALFNLLAADPSARPLLLWEGVFPDPIELEPGQEDPRFLATKAHYDRMREEDPEFTKIHFASAETPEECVLLQAHAFCDVQMGVEILMEPYASWFQEQDLRRAYAYYRDLLKMIDWQRPGDRWLLKSPAHLWAIDVLAEMFPDVCLVFTHRNPLQAMASACSLTDALMKDRESYDKARLGPLVLEYYARSLERGLAARDALDERRYVDVDYRVFVSDPLAAAERIYAHFELPKGPEVEKALRDHVEAHPQNKHGRHEYTLAEFGLSPEHVKDRMADYIRRFDLPTD